MLYIPFTPADKFLGPTIYQEIELSKINVQLRKKK